MRDALMSWLLACAAGWRRERGQTMAEYALILVLVAMVVILALTSLGSHITNFYHSVTSAIP